MRPQYPSHGAIASGNTSSPVQRQLSIPPRSSVWGSLTARSPSIQPQFNKERFTDLRARSSHGDTRERETSGDCGNQQRLHGNYGERSPTYVRNQSPPLEETSLTKGFQLQIPAMTEKLSSPLSRNL